MLHVGCSESFIDISDIFIVSLVSALLAYFNRSTELKSVSFKEK